ncbi:diguanylate cyclase [Rhodopseudomonas sp. AAP120]|nr:diguanylate cyclase [Rhodopseudomonas sp. AAP120]
MQGSVVRVTLSLIGPGIIGVFGIAFLAAWSYARRPYLGVLAAACALFALGASSQILYVPRDTGLNAMVSGALYTCAVIAAVEGVLIRSGKALGAWIDVAIFVAFSLALYYFFYVDRSLLARIYVQNFGYGLLLCVAGLRLSHLRNGRLVDRILFWTLLLFGLHFFPRTVFTVGVSPPSGGPLAFADSVFWQTLQLSLAVLGAALAMAILAAAVSDLMDDLRRERDLDHLTGLLNRRGFEAEIAAPMHRAPEGAALILCDVDHFKSINDSFGHDVGDVVLKEIGAILRRAARKGDLVGRLGGEEFAVFLPEASRSEATECAERLRRAIGQGRIPGLGHRPVTASFGVATLREAADWTALYKLADGRLYRAKAEGRDRTVDRGT